MARPETANEQRTCHVCGKTGHASQFVKNRNKCLPCERKYRNERHAAGLGRSKTQQRDWNLRHEYGITLEDYERMYAEQKGCCAICGAHHARLCVDHDHKTGEVRKLLCLGCNFFVGYLEKRGGFLHEAVAYLDGFASKTNGTA